MGLLAAVIILTREPVLSAGVRSYLDIPYVAFVLGALIVETKRPRAGLPVLLLLGLAGLLRPEAWLFSIAYVCYLSFDLGWRELRHRAGWKSLLPLWVVAVGAPVLWLFTDWVTTGNLLESFTGTQDKTAELGRSTGLSQVPLATPFKLGEILREPVLLAASIGVTMTLLFLRQRARLLITTSVIAISAFVLLAVTGLPLITRYLFLFAALMSVFAAVGIFGWMLVNNQRVRKVWMLLGGLVPVVMLIYVSNQFHRVNTLRHTIALQVQIRDDLNKLIDNTNFDSNCGPITLHNYRPVPIWALRLDQRPSDFSSTEQQPPRNGYYIYPTVPAAKGNFMLDRDDPKTILPSKSFSLVTKSPAWNLYRHCKTEQSDEGLY